MIVIVFCLDKKTGIDVSVASKQVSEFETTEQVPEQRQPNEDMLSKLFSLNMSLQC